MKHLSAHFRPTPLIPQLDFSGRPNYDPALHTEDAVKRAVSNLLDGVASDLGVDCLTAPAFIDYAGDTMGDHGVAAGIIDRVLAWCRKPQKWRK